MKLVDIMNEKWSEEYKRSIDCNNPKGFSQKAHCAGRKKNESVEEPPSEIENKLEEDVTYGYKHILHLIPTGYAPNNPKYKKDLSDLRDLLNNFYEKHGYDVRIRNAF